MLPHRFVFFFSFSVEKIYVFIYGTQQKCRRTEEALQRMKRQGPCHKGARILVLSSCFFLLAEVSVGLAGLITTTPCPKQPHYSSLEVNLLMQQFFMVLTDHIKIFFFLVLSAEFHRSINAPCNQC